jgi:phage gp46-like protein
MPDIRLIQDTRWPRHSVSVDWSLLADGTLDDDHALATAVVVALGTDRLAGRDDVLPDPDSTDRAGWWGDLDAENIWDGWPIGSKLWLLRRSRIAPSGSLEGSTVARVKQYIAEALQPFIDQRIASQFEIAAERSTEDRNRIDAGVSIYRGPRLAVDLRFQVLWDDIVRA